MNSYPNILDWTCGFILWLEMNGITSIKALGWEVSGIGVSMTWQTKYADKLSQARVTVYTDETVGLWLETLEGWMTFMPGGRDVGHVLAMHKAYLNG